MVPMEGANWVLGPGFASTDYGAHYCVVGHCVNVIAAHEVSKMLVYATSYPTHSSLSYLTPPHHATPPRHPSYPLFLLSILTAERDGKNNITFSIGSGKGEAMGLQPHLISECSIGF